MKTLGKRGRGLDPAVMLWLGTTLGIGPGIGDVHVLVSEGSAYESWLRDDLRVEPSHIHFELPAAEDALTADRNDTLLVYPGTYTVTASVGWDKKQTHLVGLGGPNTMGHYRTSSESIMSNVHLHTVTTEVAEVLNVTGGNCQMHNLLIHNEGSHASNVAALKVNKFGFYGKNLHIRGATGTDAQSAVEAGSMYVAADADYLMMENCVIGHNTYTSGLKSGAKSGHLVFSSGAAGGPQNGIFRNCYFPVRARTTSVGCVRITGTACFDRDWIFENCLFTNFWENFADNLEGVFVVTGQSPLTVSVILRGCTAVGFDEWQQIDNVNMIVADMPVVDSGGGLVRVPSTGPFTSVYRDYTSSG